MSSTQISFIDWSKALDELTPPAVHILLVLKYKVPTPNSKVLTDVTGFGSSKLAKYKSELRKAGYLDIKQTGRAEFIYTIGDPND